MDTMKIWAEKSEFKGLTQGGPGMSTGLLQGLKKFNIHTSKIYLWSHVAMPDASAAPPIGFDT